MLKAVLITGASSGIGEACAIHLARKGFRVFAAARRLDRLAALAGLANNRITPIEMDVTSDQSVDAALAEINVLSPSIYGVVNNAGISVMGPVESVPMDDWRRQFETNLFGVVRVVQKTAPILRAAGRGRIVNIGSVTGRITVPFQGAYSASKHALEAVNDAMRRELSPFGVQVSLVRPGFIKTPFGEHEQAALEAYCGDDNDYAPAVRTFKAWHAKGHPSAPGPFIVAEAVHDALTAKRPAARYVAPKKEIGSLMLNQLLPSGIADRVLDRIIKKS